jgi:hypothetical protein
VGADIKLSVDLDFTKSTAFNGKLLLGVWLGMFNTTFVSRRRDKRDYELGRTATFSLLTKSEFESRKNLGLEALQKDHFFYGNHPGESDSKRQRISFFIKDRLVSMFSSPIIGNLLYGVLLEATRKLRLDNLKEEEYYKAIEANLIKFDLLLTSHYRHVTEKKNRKVAVDKFKKPNPIKNSPLYLNAEMEVFRTYTQPLFNDLEVVQKNYLEIVLKDGFTNVKNRISLSISRRWQTLSKFAHCTKIRLQEIRKLDPTLSKIRKAQVAPDHVENLLKSYPNPATKLSEDLFHTLGPAKEYCVAMGKEISFPTTEVAKAMITVDCYKVYENTLKMDLKGGANIFKQKVDKLPQIKFEKALKALVKLNNQMGTTTATISRLRFGKKPYVMTSQLVAIKNLFQGIETSFKELNSMSIDELDLAIYAMNPAHAKSAELYLQIEQELFDSYIEDILKISQRITENEDDEGVLAASSILLKKYRK